MDAAKLVLVFFVIVLLLKLRKPLPFALLGATLATSVLYGLGFFATIRISAASLTSKGTLTLLLIFYLIMFLQRMLEKRGNLMQAQQALNGLFNNRRVNASLAPIFIGLLPSAAAVIICGSIVNSNCGEYLNAEEKTLVTSYFRHIPESIVPTYASIILGVELSGVPLASFMLGMLPMVAVLIALGYFLLLRKLPKDTGQPISTERGKELVRLAKSLWTLAVIVVLVIFGNMPVYTAIGLVIVGNIFVSKFTLEELKPIFFSAFERRLLVSSALIMLFKDVIAATGVIETLPATFAQLPVPSFFVFFLLFFFGTIISGQQAITAICVPLAFATLPNGGMPLLVLLMASGYIAMQISPTHLCLAIVTEYFHTSMASLIRRTMPIVFWFNTILLGYYLLLTMAI